MHGHADRMSSEGYAVGAAAAADQLAGAALRSAPPPIHEKAMKSTLPAPSHTSQLTIQQQQQMQQEPHQAHTSTNGEHHGDGGIGGELPVQHATHSAAGSFVTYVHRNTLCLPFHVAITPDRPTPRALQMAHRAYMDEARQHVSNTLIVLDEDTNNNTNTRGCEEHAEMDRSLVCYGTTAPPSRVTSANNNNSKENNRVAVRKESAWLQSATQDTTPLQTMSTTNHMNTTTTTAYTPRPMSAHRELSRPATVHRWRFFVTDTATSTMSSVRCTKPSTAHGSYSNGVYKASSRTPSRATSAMTQAMHPGETLRSRPLTSPAVATTTTTTAATTNTHAGRTLGAARPVRLPEELLPDPVSHALRRLRGTARGPQSAAMSPIVVPASAPTGREGNDTDGNEARPAGTPEGTNAPASLVANTEGILQQQQQQQPFLLNTPPERSHTPLVLPAVLLQGQRTTARSNAMPKAGSLPRSRTSLTTAASSSSSSSSYATAAALHATTMNTNTSAHTMASAAAAATAATELSYSKPPSHGTAVYETSFSIASQHSIRSTQQPQQEPPATRSALSCMQPPSSWSCSAHGNNNNNRDVRRVAAAGAVRPRSRLAATQDTLHDNNNTIAGTTTTLVGDATHATLVTADEGGGGGADNKAHVEEENRLGVLAVSFQRCLQSAADTLHYEPEEAARLLSLGAVFKEINLQQLYPKRHPLIDVKRAAHHHHHHHPPQNTTTTTTTTGHSSGSVRGHARTMRSPMHTQHPPDSPPSPPAMSCVEHILQPLTDAWRRSEALAEERRALGRRLRRPSARQYTLDTLLEGNAAAERVGRPLSASPEMAALLNEHRRAVMQVHELQEAERQDALCELPPM